MHESSTPVAPVIPDLEFEEPAFSKQRPGPGHDSIDDAIEAAAEDGTRSILDVSCIGPDVDYDTAAPLPAERMRELYGTDRPTRKMVDGHEFFEDIARGHCVYIVVYKHRKPNELMFAGYSYD